MFSRSVNAERVNRALGIFRFFLSTSITAWFPLPEGQYPVIFFIGGLNGYVLAELYSTVLYDISTHGFFVFGVDYEFPAYTEKDDQQVGLDIDRFFKELSWVSKTYIPFCNIPFESTFKT